MQARGYMRRIVLLAGILLALGASSAQAGQFLSLREARHAVGEYEQGQVCRGWVQGYRIKRLARVSPNRFSFEVTEFDTDEFGPGTRLRYQVDVGRRGGGVELTSPLYANPLNRGC